MPKLYNCQECGLSITEGIHDYSQQMLGASLCFRHQRFFKESPATHEAKALYFALKDKHIPVELSFAEGQHVVTISVPGKFSIEVDSSQQQSAEHDLNDLMSTIYVWKENIPTFHVSQTIVKNTNQFKLAVSRIAELYNDLGRTA